MECRGVSAAWGLLAAGVALVGCSTAEGPQACLDDTQCPAGQYCGADKTCKQDCTQGTDCPSGKCSPAGRCVGPGTDGGADQGPGDGPAAEAAPDGRVPDRGPSPDQKGAPDQKPLPDQKPPPDQSPPQDQFSFPDGVPAIPCVSVIGKPCTKAGLECGSLATCLLTDEAGTKGVCTCGCTPNDPSTVPNEDDCPGQPPNVCAKIKTVSSGVIPYCLRKCQPKLGSSDCQGGLACHPASGAAVGLYSDAVCLYYGCVTHADCPVRTNKTCVTTPPTGCASGEACEQIATGSTAGYCAKPGNCDSSSHLCGVHTLGNSSAQVGSACKDDTECAGNMYCLMPLNQATYYKKGGASCSTGVECCSGTCQGGQCAPGLCTLLYRNGYCTIAGCAFASTLTKAACPTGSHCNRLYDGGLCQKQCALATATTCRSYGLDLYGDYECRDWSNLTLGGVVLSPGPVCDFGPLIPCNTFSATSGIDCTDLGLSGNPTTMTCRGLDGAVKAGAYDPLGFCFDSTASGTAFRSPMPVP